MSAPWAPAPVPGPITPTHTVTPSNYTVGAIKRDPTSKAAAVRTSLLSSDSTLDWAVHTINYGGYYATWDDVGHWTDVNMGHLAGTGTLSATARPVYRAHLAGTGTLSATVTS
jgi:hypothetical protein